MEIKNYNDGFYFVEIANREIISIISIHTQTNQVFYLGDSTADAIEKLDERIQKGEIKLMDKIEMPAKK